MCMCVGGWLCEGVYVQGVWVCVCVCVCVFIHHKSRILERATCVRLRTCVRARVCVYL